MTIPPNTKLYRPTPDNRIETLTYKRTEGDYMILDNEAGVTVKLHKDQYTTLCHSKRVLLAEMEESLRRQIEYIHEQMRALKVEYNPTGHSEIITYSMGNTNKEVHQYCKSTGRYVASFNTIRAAARGVGKNDNPTVISKVCKGKALTAYGYKWSYERVKFL